MTISARALDLAVQGGVISTEQVARLQKIERGLAIEPVDEEKLRFIGGFGDIFVTIGLALFLGSLAYFGWTALAFDGWGPIGSAVVIAVASWALAEFFTRRRRMSLPSIVLLLTFASSFFTAAVLIIERVVGLRFQTHLDLEQLRSNTQQPFVFTGAAILTVIAVALHYGRFRVPITVAVGVAALIWTVFGLLVSLAPGFMVDHWRIVLFTCGAAVFALAMRVDISDPDRLTRRTDIAFWLHLLAAPLIVHTLIGGFVTRGAAFDVSTASIVLSCFLGLAVVAVLVDRRAILVAGLTYAGVAFATLFRQTAFADKTVPATFLVLGAFVLALSAGWRPLRAAIIGMFPRALVLRLPHRDHRSSS